MSALVLQSRQVLATRARSFRWAAAFLPERSHDRAAVLYAFCRAVDDAADEAVTPAEGLRGLEELKASLQEPPAASLGAAVLELVRAGVPRIAIDELMAGARSDLKEVRLADDGELLRYGFQVAGTVGLMMCGVLDVTDRRAARHAIDLGIGMQLTNICRDVLEDAANGRVYLPRTRLIAAGTSPEELLLGCADRQAVARVVTELLALADQYYASADAGMRYIPGRPRLAIMVASRLYRSIGLRLRGRGGDALAGRTVVPWWTKFGWVLRAVAAWSTMAFFARYRQSHCEQLHADLHALDDLPC